MVTLQPRSFSHQISEGIPRIFPSCPDSSVLHVSPGLLCIPDRFVLQEPTSENSSSTVWECSGLSLAGLSLTCLSLTGTMGSVLGVTSCREKGTTRPCVPGKKIIIDTCLGFVLPGPIKGEFWSSCCRPGSIPWVRCVLVFGTAGSSLRSCWDSGSSGWLCADTVGVAHEGGKGGSASGRKVKELGREQSLEDSLEGGTRKASLPIAPRKCSLCLWLPLFHSCPKILPAVHLTSPSSSPVSSLG